MYKITFKIEWDINFLYCNNCFFKYKDSKNIISNLNIHNNIEKYFLKYFTIPKYQSLYINQVLEDKLRGKNAKAKPFFNLI